MPETRTVPHDGKKIRDLRESKGMSLVELGELTHRHPQSLRRIELGKAASVVTLARIAKALDVKLEDITAEQGDEPAARRAS